MKLEEQLDAAHAEMQKLRIEIECLRDALEMHRKAERHRVRDATAANVSPDSVTELAMARVDLGVAHTTIEDLTLDIERYRDILRMNRNAQAKDEVLGNLAAWGLRDGGPPDVLTDAATELARRKAQSPVIASGASSAVNEFFESIGTSGTELTYDHILRALEYCEQSRDASHIVTRNPLQFP